MPADVQRALQRATPSIRLQAQIDLCNEFERDWIVVGNVADDDRMSFAAAIMIEYVRRKRDALEGKVDRVDPETGRAGATGMDRALTAITSQAQSGDTGDRSRDS